MASCAHIQIPACSSAQLESSCSYCVPLLHIFSNFREMLFFSSFCSFAWEKKQPLMSQSLDVGAQLGLVAEGGPERDHGRENGQTLTCPIGLLKTSV